MAYHGKVKRDCSQKLAYPKAGVPMPHSLRTRSLLARPIAVLGLLALALAAVPVTSLHAQAPNTITILMLDGKTGKPIIPSNFLIRINHLDALHNEWLRIDDDGLGKLNVPANASFLSVQGTYEGSMDIYVNCDASMEKDVHTIHWYSIPDIRATGVNAPNECYKGKYEDQTHIDAKPGVFVFYVRKANWHELPSE
jgi:hypothetical protein